MKAWSDDHLDALLSIESEHELFDQVAAMAKDMGFEYCAYVIQMPVPISRPTLIMFSNYLAEWRERYQSRGYLEIDPTIRHGLKNTLPIVWSHEVFASAPALWMDARRYGLRFGWTQSSRDARGAVGLLTLARGEEHITASELCEGRTAMTWLAQFAHAGMARLLIPRYMPETQVEMTTREKEVLRWTAEGKTASEIGQILAVSERTVNFHINNVVGKLGALNKTQAAVKAITLGLLL